MNPDAERYKICIECIEKEMLGSTPSDDASDDDYGEALFIMQMKADKGERWENVWKEVGFGHSKGEQRVCFHCDYLLEHVALAESEVGETY